MSVEYVVRCDGMSGDCQELLDASGSSVEAARQRINETRAGACVADGDFCLDCAEPEDLAAARQAPRTPKRIRLSRAKGWRKPAGAVVVARPTRWGNPFRLGAKLLLTTEGHGMPVVTINSRADAVTMFRGWLSRPGQKSPYLGIPRPPEDLSALRGRDLACWCPLDQPCHADVLLEYANREEATAP